MTDPNREAEFKRMNTVLREQSAWTTAHALAAAAYRMTVLAREAAERAAAATTDSAAAGGAPAHTATDAAGTVNDMRRTESKLKDLLDAAKHRILDARDRVHMENIHVAVPPPPPAKS